PCVYDAKNSVDAALLRKVRDCSNLAVITGATARRIDMTGRSVDAVEYSLGEDPQLKKLKCRFLLLAPGATQSPRLLMLSGIQPGKYATAIGRYLTFHQDVKLEGVFSGHFDLKMIKKLAIMDNYSPPPDADFVNHASIQTGTKSHPVAAAQRVFKAREQ